MNDRCDDSIIEWSGANNVSREDGGVITIKTVSRRKILQFDSSRL
jgi:hypothetical protein